MAKHLYLLEIYPPTHLPNLVLLSENEQLLLYTEWSPLSWFTKSTYKLQQTQRLSLKLIIITTAVQLRACGCPCTMPSLFLSLCRWTMPILSLISNSLLAEEPQLKKKRNHQHIISYCATVIWMGCQLAVSRQGRRTNNLRLNRFITELFHCVACLETSVFPVGFGRAPQSKPSEAYHRLYGDNKR